MCIIFTVHKTHYFTKSTTVLHVAVFLIFCRKLKQFLIKRERLPARTAAFRIFHQAAGIKLFFYLVIYQV